MRRVLRCVVVAGAACGVMAATPAADPMPANTVMLSQMMRELSAQPGFTEKVLSVINGGQKAGAVLTPELVDLLRKLILGKDWSGLDRFPGWTMRRVNSTVDLGTRVFGEKLKPETKSLTEFIHLGPYSLEHAQTEDLDQPSDRPGFSAEGLVSNLGMEVIRGDGPDPRLAPLHAESARLAEVLNRLSLNGLEGAAPFTAKLGSVSATTPEAVIDALTATGHDVVVADARYFANFGHFHYKGQDVMMPFFLDSQIEVPGGPWWKSRRHLLVPVSHAEYELIVHGPRINADVTFYFGIDGRAEFRTNDQLNQPWVMGRHAHEYRGGDAREVMRLLGRFTIAYTRLHLAYPRLPFGGYYTLGVCQDAVSAIEKKMTGQTTLFPNSADFSFFKAPEDAEVNALLAEIPKDKDGAMPSPERIFGSLPTTDFNSITVPGLRSDVQMTYAAWQQGKLHHVQSRWVLMLEGMAALAAVAFTLWGWRRYKKLQQS